MISILIPAVLAGTAVVQVGSNYDKQTLNVNEGDSIVWEFRSPESRSVTQVTKDCLKIDGGFDSGPLKAPNMFYHTFREPGLVYYASSVGSDCSNGFRAVVNVAPFPVNMLAVQKWQRYQDKAVVAKASLASKNIPAFLLPLLIVLAL